jgi:RNA polymerase sigma factor (sigma-70 family)
VSTSSDQVHQLYDSHHSWLRTWLRGKLNNVHQAADLAHDVFVRVLSKPSDLDQVREPRAYLTTIARHLLFDHWRRQQIEQAWLETVAAQPEQFAPSPEETALALEALMAVDTMLNRLGERPRQAFLMSQVYGMRYHEIGTALGVSERMIKKYMAQAMLHCLALDMSAAPAA